MHNRIGNWPTGNAVIAHQPADPLPRGTPDPAPPDDFIFKIDGKRPKYSDEQLISSLRAFAQTVNGRAFKMAEFNAWPGRVASANTMYTRFGNWRIALKRAGINDGRCRQYDAADLMQHLEAVWRKLGRAPGSRCLRRHGPISYLTYKSRWGSLKRACALLAAYKAGRISKAELLLTGPRDTRKAIPPSLRWQVMTQGQHRCATCGSTVEDGAKLEIDHIVPVSKGGTDAIENLRILCFACNRGKGGKH